MIIRGTILKGLIEVENEWSIEFFAEYSGISIHTLRSYIYSHRVPSVDRLNYMLKLLIPDDKKRLEFLKEQNPKYYFTLQEETAIDRKIKGLTVGEFLRRLRSRHKLTLEILSNISGMTIASISNIERNKQFPSRATFLSLINAYGLKPKKHSEALKIFESLRTVHLESAKKGREQEKGNISSNVVKLISEEKTETPKEVLEKITERIENVTDNKIVEIHSTPTKETEQTKEKEPEKKKESSGILWL